MTNTMRRIKWENITFILSILYSIFAIAHHLEQPNQTFTTTTMIILEAPIYLLFSIFMRFITKQMRLSLH